MGNTEPTRRIAWIGLLFGLGSVSIWTGFILVSRAGALSPLGLTDMVAVRFGTALLVLSPLVWRLRRHWLQPKMFLLGGIGGLAYALSVYAGFERAPANHAALLLPGLMPIVIALLAAVALREDKSPTVWLGIAVSTTGIVVLMLESLLASRATLVGDLFFMLACVFWGIYTVMLRAWKLQPWTATTVVVVVTAILYLPVYALWLPKGWSEVSWQTITVQAFYQGVMATIVQMVFYVKAVQLLGATRMGALMALVPVLVGILAVPLFGEVLSQGAFIGIALGCLGAGLGLVPATFWRRRAGGCRPDRQCPRLGI